MSYRHQSSLRRLPHVLRRREILLFALIFLFFNVRTFGSDEIFVCKVDGVTSFQSEPCQELLDGAEESENAQLVEVDTEVNTVENSDSVKSDVINRARNVNYYHAKKQSDHDFGQNTSTYRPSRHKTRSHNNSSVGKQTANRSSECRYYQRQQRNNRERARQGYRSSSSNYVKRQQRSTRAGLDKYCR